MRSLKRLSEGFAHLELPRPQRAEGRQGGRAGSCTTLANSISSLPDTDRIVHFRRKSKSRLSVDSAVFVAGSKRHEPATHKAVGPFVMRCERSLGLGVNPIHYE